MKIPIEALELTSAIEVHEYKTCIILVGKYARHPFSPDYVKSASFKIAPENPRMSN